MSMKTSDQHGGTREWAITAMPKFPGGSTAYVLPGAFHGSIVALMAEAGFKRADSVDDADVVVFAGGADINPALYNEKNVKSYGINKTRDDLEVAAFKRAVELKKVCFGICRGAQLLHALNGGKLWQDVNNHGRSHWIVDIEEDVRVLSTSMHHQMLQENDDLTVVAVTEEEVSSYFEDADLVVNLEAAGSNGPPILEIEAGAYESTRCFFVQGHPEVGDPPYRSWTMQKLLDFYLDWKGDLRKISEIPHLQPHREV